MHPIDRIPNLCLTVVLSVLFGLCLIPSSPAEYAADPAAQLIERGHRGALSDTDWIEALQAKDPLICEAALSLALRGGEREVFLPTAKDMASLTPEVRTRLISVLGMRGNAAALPAIRPSLQADHAAERIAAVRTLGELKDTASKGRLIELAVSEDPAAEAAREALSRIPGSDIDETLRVLFVNGPETRRIRALKTLVLRGCRTVVPTLLSSEWMEGEARISAAAEALAALGTDREFGEILEYALGLPGSSGKDLQDPLARIILTSADPHALLDTLKNRIAREDVETRISYIGFLSRAQCEATIELLAEYARGDHPDLAQRAVRTLAAWDDTGSVDLLFELADSSDAVLRRSSLEALSILVNRRKIRNGAWINRINEALAEETRAESRAADSPGHTEAANPADDREPSEADAGTWVPLFNGENLDGWHALPGGTWFVLDGQIIGIGTHESKSHALLISDKRYRDFHLRVEFMSVLGNSGLYFRTERVDHPVAVKGFQAEICPAGFPVGGLYETLGRAWVAHSDREEVNAVFKKYDWNVMEVRAVGGDIQVVLNGKKVCEVKDDPGLPEGYIGLQLHGNADLDVRFRTIEIMEIPQS
ncbi:DUF1080 domain-containing protein [Kiritimatiella glycovorans]|uniref:3-keto-alpha-glucoside-1,2-lyase/3-keto-2-hydroxy-glucal hydratase domain-containing protein n=1 Tax=Kiritimatiella glycovorans TaxID=1307763 RepID=A0A0G3EG64_9BACT|nr:family 16 glycoside hydrolase [Kiritimatiella glycovorans]AKJ64387.1 hypothetical protein L21SP4_01137 [Kiritimatiella glycovorans]